MNRPSLLLAGLPLLPLGNRAEEGPVRDCLGAAHYSRLAMALRAGGRSPPEVESGFCRNAQRLLCASRRAE